jgi:hypothetical protein
VITLGVSSLIAQGWRHPSFECPHRKPGKPGSPRRQPGQEAQSIRNVAGRGPPDGTVTFLFTDIEGSTRHWEQYPQAVQVARNAGGLCLCLASIMNYEQSQSHNSFVLQ